MPGYTALFAACAASNIELFESVMRLTRTVNVGNGSLVVAFSAEGKIAFGNRRRHFRFNVHTGSSMFSACGISTVTLRGCTSFVPTGE